MPFTPPLDYNNVRIGLIRAVMAATGLGQNNVMMAEPEEANAPRPSLPYMTMKLISPGIKYAVDASSMVSNADETLTVTTQGPRGVMVSFNSYGRSHEEAYNYMGAWQAALDSELTQVALRPYGIAVWRTQNVRDLSALLSTGYEGRAQMDVLFGVGSTLSQTLDSVAQVNLTGTVTP